MDCLHVGFSDKADLPPSLVAIGLTNDLDPAHRLELPGDQFEIISNPVLLVI